MCFNRRMTNEVVFITGASSGIGEALAREWAMRGARLVLTARRKDRIDALAEELGSSAKVLAVACDVNDPEELGEATAKALETFGRIDIVVANAGFGVVGAFEKLTLADYRRQLETNVFGVISTVKATLDALTASKGRLAIVGSVNSFITLPNGTPYGMSKYAVRALAEGLHAELKPQGVSVTLIAPGFVSSEIRQVDNQGEFKADRREPIPAWLIMPAEKAAKKIVNAVMRRKSLKIVTGHAHVAIFISRHMPWLLRWLLQRVGVKSRGEPKE